VVAQHEPQHGRAAAIAPPCVIAGIAAMSFLADPDR
jgi:hypothetical protein